MKVSIIMSFTDRLVSLRNTLAAWSRITYPDCEFILVSNGCKQNAYDIVTEFRENTNHLVGLIRYDNYLHVNRVWNRIAKEFYSNDYVIFAMMDEIISDYDIVQKMIAYGNQRATINTYFLGEKMALPEGWENNPKLIETIPGFWDYEDKGSANRDKVDASLLSHIIGWPRERWDWFGWFRDNERGHLWLDQDVVIRSRVLGIKSETVKDVVCYHQWHEQKVDPMWLAPGYHPVNERQARLLEESERDKS